MNNHVVEVSEEDEFISAELFDSVIKDVNFVDVIDDDLIVNDEFHEFERINEGRNYIAGYICKKLNLQPLNNDSSNSWISVKGEGRLIEPNRDVVEVCAKCDINFYIL